MIDEVAFSFISFQPSRSLQMKTIGILIIIAGTAALYVQAALPQIGLCGYQSYNNKIRTCITPFIKGLQKTPKEDCDIHRASFINCSAVAVHSCLPLIAIEDMKNALKPQLTDELMCQKAGLQYPDPSQVNVTFSCKMTNSDYVTKINECTNNLVKKWSANRADSTICREYRDVKKCMKNAIDKYCQVKEDFQEVVNHQFDDYNPFCANNKDPTRSPTTSPTTSPTSSAAVTNVPNIVDPTTKPTTSTQSEVSSVNGSVTKASNLDPNNKVSSITISKAVIGISLLVATIQAF